MKPDAFDPAAPLPLLLTVPQLAKVIGFTPKGVYSLVEKGQIPHVRISNRVRFLRDDVLAWLRESRVGPASPRR